MRARRTARFGILLLGLSFGLFASMPAYSAKPSRTVRNFPPTSHRAPNGTSLADVAAAITDAARTLDWSVNEEGAESLVATLWVRRKHRAVVRIGFDETNYWIEYVDSENLNYSENDLRVAGPSRRFVKGPRIHPNYNRWVETLARAIEDRTAHSEQVRRQKPRNTREPSLAPPNPPAFVADELEKLDSLRERGVLTQEEFDLEKAKLLSR